MIGGLKKRGKRSIGWWLTKKQVLSRMFPPAAVVMIGTLASRILGIAREIIFATKYGAPPELDAYQAAFQLPDLLTRVFVIGAFSSAFIPVFASYLETDRKQDAKKLADVITTWLIMILVVLSLLIFILAPVLVPLIAPGFDEVRRQSTIVLMRIMLLSPILLGMSNVLSSILNSHHKIFAATLSPIMYNLGIIMGALVFEPLVGIVWGLGLGVAFGAFMHFAIQLWPVARLGFKFSWDLDFKFEGVKDVIRLATPRMIGLAIAQADMFVDVILGSFLPVGSIALLNYANRLQTMPVGIFGMAIATACFPVFVQKSVKKDWQGFNQVLFKNLKYVLFFTIPTTVAMVLMRVEIIRILFGQSGKLSWFETRSVAFALSLYAISIFAQSTVYILSRAFYAVQDTKTPVVASLISVGLNSLLSFILVITVQHFSMLALSYSIASLVNMTLLFVMLHHKLGGFKINSFLQSLLAILSSSLVMGLAIWAMRYGLQNFLDLSRVRDLAIEISICSLVGVGIYFVSMSALGKNEMGNFLNSFKKGKKC